ncbi:MAG: M20/M25/M40 family metallo-hydrolase, partial [Cytophagales bacterium]|nr:M20/M25/M40 family metallo-hydrolase [Cytophagales bacterium]
MIKALKAIGILLVLFVGVLLFNTLTLSSKQIDVEAVEKIEVSDQAIARFQGALRFPTISNMDIADFDSIPFINQIKYIADTYPLVDSLLNKEIVGGYSLLYKWEGNTEEKLPILIYSHYDVVPVDSATINDWEAPPFSGEVKNGNIYGRGAIDDKVGVFGTLEAIETLLSQGFQPARTLYFGFGHDEEIGGIVGASSIGDFLEKNMVKLEYSLDEGIPILDGIVNGVDGRVAMISTAEKGYVSYKLTITTEGGHSSSPAPGNTIGSLARAIVALEDNQFEYSLKEPMDQQ